MRHLHVRHIKDVEAFVLYAFDRKILPGLVQMTGKTGMKPHVVLKDENMSLHTLRNSPPNFNMRFGNRHLGPAHSDRCFKLVPRWKCLRLRLDKKLICQRVIGIDVGVFGWILRKTSGVHSDVPFREAEKIIAEPISYASKLLLDAGPTGWLAVEVDYVDLFNRLTVRRSLSAERL